MGEWLSTGIEHLDQQIGGGLVPGSIVCLRTSPESQGEILLKELATTHGALYLSTTRTDASVEEWLSADGEEVDVQYAGIDGLSPRGGDAVREWIADAAGWSNGESNGTDGVDGAVQIEAVASAASGFDGCVVIDPVNPLERGDESTYVRFLHGLQRRLRETEKLAFLHVVETQEVPDGRWLTLQMADEVWDVSVDVQRMRVEFLLTVTKSRSGEMPSRQIKLDLGGDVTIDTSRDIA